MSPDTGFAQDQGSVRDPSKAMMKGLVIGLILGIIIGGVLGVMLPEASQRALPLPEKKAAGPMKPAVTVTVSSRGEPGAKTLHVENASDKALANVEVKAFRPRSDETKTFAIGALAPKASKDIAAAEWDWKITSEDTFEVTADGFSSVTYTER
jgi:hypothetical protein